MAFLCSAAPDAVAGPPLIRVPRTHGGTWNTMGVVRPVWAWDEAAAERRLVRETTLSPLEALWLAERVRVAPSDPLLLGISLMLGRGHACISI